MARWAIIRRVMLATPGDTADLVDAARQSIYGWNSESDALGWMLEPVHWKSDVYPNFNPEGGQPEIDAQILQDSDILVGIFRHRLGTPTKDAPSGTAHEILKHVANGGTVMAYFSKEAVPQNADFAEYQRLQDFKKECQKQGVMGEFQDPASFGQTLKSDLRKFSNRYELTSTVRLNAFRKYFARRNWGEIIRNDRPDFNFHALPISDGKAELWCVTFRPNPDDSSNPYSWWQPLRPFRIKNTRLEKAEIYKAMEENYIHGFKFYLRVPNTQESLREYRNALATADVIVTGKGSVDADDPDWWRIWFFHPEGFVHPYSARSYLANHSLVDLSWL